MSSFRPGLWIAAAAVVAAAAWAGGTAHLGSRAQDAAAALAQDGALGLRIRDVRHARSFTSAQGSFVVDTASRCEKASDALTLKVAYTLDHTPRLGSLMRARWTASAAPEAAEHWAAVFGAGAVIAGETAFTLGGATATTFALPRVALQGPGGSLDAEASTGVLRTQGEALALHWALNQLTARGAQGDFSLRGLAVDIDLDNRRLGTGLTVLRAEQLRSASLNADGVVFRSEAKATGDTLDARFSQTAQRLNLGAFEGRGLALEASLKGVDRRAAETLTRIAESGCDLRELNPQERDSVRAAFTAILSRGVTAQIDRLAGTTTEGDLEARLQLVLAPAAQPGQVDLPTQLRASGSAALRAPKLAPALRVALTENGMTAGEGDRLQGAFEYAAGTLTVNGSPRDGTALQAVLAGAGERMQAALAP